MKIKSRLKGKKISSTYQLKLSLQWVKNVEYEMLIKSKPTTFLQKIVRKISINYQALHELGVVLRMNMATRMENLTKLEPA